MKCENCKFANKSGNEDFVYCTFWQKEANNYKASEEEFIREVMFKNPFPEKVALGWGYPKQHYKLESHWVHKGTATEGLMWNNQICIHKEDRCHEFQSI